MTNHHQTIGLGDRSRIHADKVRERKAFSLIELLVVIAIVALLLGLTIPAVQYASESARRSQCQSQLHQFGVALQNYHSQHGRFRRDGFHGYGIGVFLLPQLDRRTLFEKIQPYQTERNGYQVAGDLTVLEVFRCPSDDGDDHVPPSGFEKANYIGSQEMFSRTMMLTDVHGGESNTIAFGETIGDHTWPLPGLAESIPPGHDGKFASRHGQGALFLFCDGAVKFIPSKVDSSTFRSLCTPTGGEVPGEF